ADRIGPWFFATSWFFGPSCFATGKERDPNFPLISGHPLRMANMARWYVYTAAALLAVPLLLPAPFAAAQNPSTPADNAPAHKPPAHKAPANKSPAHKRPPAKPPAAQAQLQAKQLPPRVP